jgi:hypothetical protein
MELAFLSPILNTPRMTTAPETTFSSQKPDAFTSSAKMQRQGLSQDQTKMLLEKLIKLPKRNREDLKQKTIKVFQTFIKSGKPRLECEGLYLPALELKGQDLGNAYLRGAYLLMTDLTNSNLRKADLRDAYLRKTQFENADLRGANLKGVYKFNRKGAILFPWDPSLKRLLDWLS